MCDARDRDVVSRLPYVEKATPNGDFTCENWLTTVPATKKKLKAYYNC